MQFFLTGFTQEKEFRVFAFEGVAADRVRVAFTVRANLDLSRRYGIALQELPLICREILEHRSETDQQHAMTLTEEAMQVHASNSAARALAARAKRPPRRKPNETTGSAWRAPLPL